MINFIQECAVQPPEIVYGNKVLEELGATRAEVTNKTLFTYKEITDAFDKVLHDMKETISEWYRELNEQAKQSEKQEEDKRGKATWTHFSND